MTDVPGTELVRLPDGRQLELWTGGGDGDAVLVLPGCPDSRLVALTGAAAARSVGVRLVAVNRPGYGRSTPHPSDHETVAEDLGHVVDTLGIDRFAVLGMSVGGPYALACAARHPDRVAALAVVASPAATRPELASRTVTECVELIRPEFEDFVARMDPADPDDSALVRRFLDQLPEEDARLLQRLDVATLAASTREALGDPSGYLRDAAVTFRAWPFRVEDVGCPTTLWYGERDTNAPPPNGRLLAARLTRARLVVGPTTHLATLLTQWEEILAALAA